MTLHDARKRAKELGLSAWVVQFVPAGMTPEGTREVTRVHRIGFVALNFAIAEGPTWGEAWKRATRIIFGP
ncbi:MAG TPA: hypothetical protein VI198_01640 [Candidatus Eisenbacteria bacterium]